MRKRNLKAENKKKTVKPRKEEEEDDDDEKKDRGKGGFYACYLLTSLCPRFKGHTYIGFTVNPRRRIRQHNGEIGMGAWRTKKRRPWEMVFCLFGFPTNVSALQFEWAWQHPRESVAVRQSAAAFKSLSGVANKIKLAYTMLNLPAWQSFNITVNYFSTKYTKLSTGCPSLPEHMKVQVCPMDELPCYTEAGEFWFEEADVEDCSDIDGCERTNDASGTVKANMMELEICSVANEFSCYSGTQESSLGSEDGRSGKDDGGEHSGGSNTSGTITETNADVIHIPADYAHEIEKPSCEQKYGWLEEYGKHPQSDLLSPEVDYEQPFGFIPSPMKTSPAIISSFSMRETGDVDTLQLTDEVVCELDWPAENEYTTKTATNKDLQSTAVSHEIEVIDLLSPSPGCRIMPSSKKRRVSEVFPVIIDLT